MEIISFQHSDKHLYNTIFSHLFLDVGVLAQVHENIDIQEE